MNNIKSGFSGSDSMRAKAERLLGGMGAATKEPPMSRSSESSHPYRRPFKEGGSVTKEFEEGGGVAKKLEKGGAVPMEKGGSAVPMKKGGCSHKKYEAGGTVAMETGGEVRNKLAMGGVAKIRHKEATKTGLPIHSRKRGRS